MVQSTRIKLATPLRWTARILGLALAGLVVVFAIGNRLNPAEMPLREFSMLLALVTACLGCVALWRYERAGGALAVAGITTFYALNFLYSGRFPSGWVLPLFFVPGIVALIAWALNCRAPPLSKTAHSVEP
jgi:hypothetical protein